MKKIMIIITIMLLVSLLAAKSTGEYGFQMLKINTSVGIAAQSGCGTFTTSDANIFTQNAAATLFLSGKKISVVKNFWLFDTSMNGISYISSNNNRSFGISMRALDYGKFDRRDEVGTEILGEFHPLDLNVTLNFARRINPSHYFGINIIGLYEKIDSSSAVALAFDLGYDYRTPITGLDFNIALKNLGFSGKMDQEKIKLPFATEIGINKTFNIKRQFINTEIKLIQNSGDEKLKFSFGINTSVMDVLTLRTGYKINDDLQSFSAGFGVNIKRFTLDYAFIPSVNDVNSVNMIGITYRM